MKTKPQLYSKGRMIVTIVTILLTVSNKAYTQNKINIRGFSEFNYTAGFGESSDKVEAEEYKHFGLIDGFSEEVSDLVFPGINLIFSSNLEEEKLSFLAELNFFSLQQSTGIRVERAFLDYSINNKFNFQLGIFLNPFGYLNRNQRNIGYLNTSASPRDMVNPLLGLIPVRTFGFNIYGTPFETESGVALNYVFALGSGRGVTPQDSPFEVDLFEQHGSHISFTGLIEMVAPIGISGELTIGLSAFIVPEFHTVLFDSLGRSIEKSEFEEIIEEAEEGHDERHDEDVEGVALEEVGFAPFISLKTQKLDFLFEYHGTKMSASHHGFNEDLKYNAFSTQLIFKTNLGGKTFNPYIRYDHSSIPENGGPYYGLKEEHETVSWNLVSGSSAIMIGASWDLFKSNRTKLEYSYFLDGPHPTNGIILQTSFAF